MDAQSSNNHTVMFALSPTAYLVPTLSSILHGFYCSSFLTCPSGMYPLSGKCIHLFWALLWILHNISWKSLHVDTKEASLSLFVLFYIFIVKYNTQRGK